MGSAHCVVWTFVCLFVWHHLMRRMVLNDFMKLPTLYTSYISLIDYPIHSMYGIYAYIDPANHPWPTDRQSYGSSIGRVWD